MFLTFIFRIIFRIIYRYRIIYRIINCSVFKVLNYLWEQASECHFQSLYPLLIFRFSIGSGYLQLRQVSYILSSITF
ncbi:MAG: hypothetical protein CVU06_06735 [Bacteroidetes bacterium HGW-Bacteroidetes-22]|nr:MAG: hypothetical protein CVU06_06735 [Bacteroidetes bacterium HGW-Bacteroidetes-22]